MFSRPPSITAHPGRSVVTPERVRQRVVPTGRGRDRTVTAPAVSTTLAVGAALALSTLPSLLPRSPAVQGILTGALVLLALTVVWCGRLVVARWRAGAGRPGQRFSPPLPPDGRRSRALLDPGGGSVRVRWLVVAGTSSAVAGAASWAQLALDQHAADLAMPAPGLVYWPSAAAAALLVVGLGTAVVAGVRRLARITWRHTPLPLAATLLVGVTVTTAAAGSVDLLAPLRKPMDPHHVLLTDSPTGASRSFTLVDEAETPEVGAQLAVDRLVAEGGLDRGAILIALPTGSGWVNADAVASFETQLDGDVAVVSAQYGDLPSWWSFLLDQEPAMRSAEALVDEVLTRVAELPADQRPDVFVHGESLGAQAGQAAVTAVDEQDICGLVWSGAPGGALSGHPRERSVHNADDPVSRLSMDTALARPEDWPATWLPGLSYGTTVLDLGASLLPDPGHGHRYGPEQDWTLPTC